MTANQRRDAFEVLSGFYLLFLLILIFITAALGNYSLFVVIIGFFPTVLMVLIALTIHDQYTQQKKLLWLLSLLILAGFYAIGMTSASIYNQIDVPVLTGINFILSILYIIMVYGVFQKPKPKKNLKKKVEVEPEGSIEEYIHSIEDKSKALNFVVGRVYNKYHGGTSQMRDKLRIPSEWYNEFSLLGIGTDTINKEQLLDLITRFELQLKNYEKKEFEVFKSDTYKLKNLIQDPHGSDKIIDVLDHNDKDPVRSYYEGAVKFCIKVREAVEHHDLNLVKNEYIPKTDEEKEEIEAINHVTDDALSYDASKTTKTTSHTSLEQEKKKGPKRP